MMFLYILIYVVLAVVLAFFLRFHQPEKQNLNKKKMLVDLKSRGPDNYGMWHIWDSKRNKR